MRKKRGRIREGKLWDGRYKPYYKLLNLDLYTMTTEELEGKRIKAKEEARKRAEEKKQWAGE